MLFLIKKKKKKKKKKFKWGGGGGGGEYPGLPIPDETFTKNEEIPSILLSDYF